MAKRSKNFTVVLPRGFWLQEHDPRHLILRKGQYAVIISKDVKMPAELLSNLIKEINEHEDRGKKKA